MGSQQFCLKWNNHQSNMLTVFEQLLSNEALVDVTLACEGLSLKAHKMVLSACSPFFQALFVENPCKHPIVILKDMRYMDLKAIVEFMYRGEVNVSQDQLSALLKTAETLKVKGLAEVTGENRQGLVPVGTTEGDTKGTTTPRAESPPLSKRKRGRPRRRSPSDSNKSDSEDAMTRVKGAPESPEIIEDGSLSSDRLAVPSPAKIAATSSKVLLAASSATTTTTNAAAVVSTTREPVDSVVDDADGSPEDADFEVDASNLMEQSMTTENVPVFSDVPSSSQLAESQTHHTGSSQESSAAPLIPASLPSDISISTQDIKPLPSSLIPYDEPTISPVVPGQQQSADGSASSSMMFMDSSGVPAIAGPSNYHPDKQPSTPSHGLLLPEVLKVEEARQGQIDFFQAEEGGKPEIPTRRSRRLFPSNVCSMLLKEDRHLDADVRRKAGDETRKRSRRTSLSVSEKLQGSQECTNTGRKQRVCNVCEKSFQRKGHIRVHTGERPFTCSVCQKSFSQRGNLEHHILIHTGERPFTCNVCEASFSQKGHLDRHIRIHTGARPFSCNVCEKSFKWKSSLNHHIRVHRGERPFACNTCKRSFTCKSNLHQHIRIHTGAKPFTCTVCEKSFSRKRTLDTHRCSHTGAKPLPCPTC